MQGTRWQLLLPAQEKLWNPYLLSRLVGRRARLLMNGGGGPRTTAEAIDQALQEVAAGTLAPAAAGMTPQL